MAHQPKTVDSWTRAKVRRIEEEQLRMIEVALSEHYGQPITWCETCHEFKALHGHAAGAVA